jgi:Uma2 family endonuclease
LSGRSSLGLPAGGAVLPDLLVVRCDDAGPRWIEEPLLLAVEVVAAETRMVDELLKRRVYEQAGVASYWMVEPANASMTVLELEAGHTSSGPLSVGMRCLWLRLRYR